MSSVDTPSPHAERSEQPNFSQDERFTPDVIEALAGPATRQLPGGDSQRVRVESYMFTANDEHYFKMEGSSELPIPLSELQFSRDRQRELKQAGIDLAEFVPSSEAPTQETPERPDAELSEYEQDFYSATPEQQQQMYETAEDMAWDDYERARAAADQRELEKVRAQIARTEKRGAHWSEAQIKSASEEALAESQVTKEDLDAAEVQRDADMQAAVDGPLDHKQMMELLKNRTQVVERLARSGSEIPSMADYQRAERQYRRILETGKVSGRDTGKGVDSSFSEYTARSLRRIKTTWKNPRNHGLFGVRRLMTSGIRVTSEIVGYGLFTAAKLGARQLEKRRINKLLGY